MEPDFNTVWNRVTGAEPQKSETELLRDLILRKGKDIAAYQLLRQKLAGSNAAAFRQLEQEEREQRHKLQTHYFLLTGDSVTMHPEPYPVISNLLAALRDCYNRELETSRLLRSLYSRFQTPTLQALCMSLSEQETAHARLLYDIIERLL